ncbi:MAG: hypothetical protein ACI9MR_000109 [Myxococcota bacterium]|jgi:hypothetical protein
MHFAPPPQVLDDGSARRRLAQNGQKPGISARVRVNVNRNARAARELTNKTPAATQCISIGMTGLEILGYIASVLIALSMTMSSLWRLRWVNLAGGLAMAAYGFMLSAYPIVAVNVFTVSVNVFHLWKLARAKHEFRVINVPDGDYPFLQIFLDHYGDDIAESQPEFDLAALAAPRLRFIVRNVVSVGLFVYEEGSDGIVLVRLDYVVPGYRDFKQAHFTYGTLAEMLVQRGFHTFAVDGCAPVHQRYLQRLDFVEDKDRPGRWVRAIG